MQNTEFYSVAVCFEVELMLSFSANVDTAIQTSISFTAVNFAAICRHTLTLTLLMWRIW